MRLLRVYIDGYRNLKNVEVDFDRDSLTTVLIGENGSGKSNLIEAIVEIFRAWSLGTQKELRFRYSIFYVQRGVKIQVRSDEGLAFDTDANPELKTHIRFDQHATTRMPDPIIPDPDKPGDIVSQFFPDFVFGYYSGSGRRLEKLFDEHQSRYYARINKARPEAEYEEAHKARSLFYCRPVHGVLALLAYFAKPGKNADAKALLTEKLSITGFHSALALIKEPSWFSGSKVAAVRETSNLWGAHGPAGDCVRALRDTAFHPLELEGSVVDDYRRKASKEAQLACFLRDDNALKKFASNYKSDQDMFTALEAADISDLLREMIVWVTRKNDESGDISFSDLSDGERQLLMVLGLIRVSRGKEALFLLDEPDTHLNPAWQLTYLDLIREWTEVAADEGKCQIIMTTHNPLTIAALEAKEVRVMSSDDEGNVSVAPPRIDPKGLGFAGVLTDIFGLSSSLDKPTQELIDKRNKLASKEELTPAMAKEFEDIKNELRHLGFLYEERDRLYSEFLRQLDRVELADVEPLTPDELREREAESREIVERLLKRQ
ncbi:AAA family ATPase [Mesorhizobium sp. M0019]|uniref:AAA family ATPase n=1 Tax=Mesorhizobium sp. M0019 TaxID=2956845 RepID=UPI0033350D3B